MVSNALREWQLEELIRTLSEHRLHTTTQSVRVQKKRFLRHHPPHKYN